MKKKLCILLIVMAFFTGGCSSLLPSTRRDIGSRWKTFDEAKTAFDNVVPYKTTSEELESMGIDPFTTPNTEILTYLDIIHRFMPNPSITEEDIAQGIQDCLSAKDDCQAHEFVVKEISKKRYGNLILDFFNFKRQTRTSGWEFHPLIVVKDDLVVYKMWSGKPNINETVEETNPLGPLQNTGNFLTKLVNGLI